MGSGTSRTVEIQISNKTQDFTLKNPRTYFFSGHSLSPPDPFVPPGSSSTSKFSNNTLFWGCNGLLAYEAESLTLAIYFSNPIDYNRFSVELGLELSPCKADPDRLKNVYTRLAERTSEDSNKKSEFHRISIKEHQEQAQVSAGPIKVTATMSNSRNSILKVVLEEQEGLGKKAGIETPGPGKHFQEK